MMRVISGGKKNATKIITACILTLPSSMDWELYCNYETL